ncbi:MFS transporter [Streptomyces boninensis]|uniref:MFS transporter n=1 Tax=Streptomyces boninensis TaxID=2039455 RepID=UPI003B2169A8
MNRRAFAALPRSLKSLIVLSFVVALGSYMVTPFLGVLMVKWAGFDIRLAGGLVAAATFIQFAGSIAGGWVVARIGLKRTMVGALLLRTTGLLLLGLADRLPAIAYPAVLLVAAGPALYLPANKAYIVASVPDEKRPLFLGVSSAALNAGMGLGPLLAALLLESDPLMMLCTVAALFAVITVAHQVTLRPRPLDRTSADLTAAERSAPSRTGASVRQLRGALQPMVFTVLAFYLYFFFQSFIGLYAAETSALRSLGWVLLVNCAIVVLLQPPLSGLIARAGYRRLLSGSFALMGAGAAAMSAGHLAALLAGTVLFSLGEVFLFLRSDLELLERLPDSPAFAFGVQRLTAGVGGMLAGVVGGFVFAQSKAADRLGWFWLAVALQCALAALGALVFGGRGPAGPVRQGQAAGVGVAR